MSDWDVVDILEAMGHDPVEVQNTVEWLRAAAEYHPWRCGYLKTHCKVDVWQIERDLVNHWERWEVAADAGRWAVEATFVAFALIAPDQIEWWFHKLVLSLPDNKPLRESIGWWSRELGIEGLK